MDTRDEIERIAKQLDPLTEEELIKLQKIITIKIKTLGCLDIIQIYGLADILKDYMLLSKDNTNNDWYLSYM